MAAINGMLTRMQHMSSGEALQLVTSVFFVYAATAIPMLVWAVYSLLKQPTKGTQLNGKMTSVAAAGSAAPEPANTHVDQAQAAWKLVRDRRSVFPKDMTGELVERARVEQLLEAANWAPTHGRTEPWRFVVLSPEGRQEMVDISRKELQQQLDPAACEKKLAKLSMKEGLYKKVTFIAICYRRQALPDKLQPEWEEAAATACAVQNVHLMCQPLGVAGYWSSWQGESICNAPAMKTFLRLGDEDRCMGFFLLGTPDRERTAGYRAKRGPMQDKILWR